MTEQMKLAYHAKKSALRELSNLREQHFTVANAKTSQKSF